MTPTLIVPGYLGSGEGHWQRHWLARDPRAVLVEQDNWEAPDLDRWLARLGDYVARFPGSTLVAHSLGVPLVAHLARRHPDLDIARALFVAPADVDLRVDVHECFRSFVPMPLNRLSFPVTVAASRNDIYVAFERAASFAVAWGARLIDLGYAGHVNVESGFGAWPGAPDLLPPLPVSDMALGA
ncbi:RBBP9/YdeN family alpha/beta hydrolase [Pelagibacterium lacus]|uniref:Serine hydrolase family protein n=1 Tax=Pelagibacterium lacus TaxID=2282655 RepID=A0A369W1S3_9HYPH|nr:alpha/beta hydrolase [Pelagibacterium lacus]RDE07835.1 serine hydrolase family protein [Pelagibacterium lacus]